MFLCGENRFCAGVSLHTFAGQGGPCSGREIADGISGGLRNSQNLGL
jgi:hypothetical protein